MGSTPYRPVTSAFAEPEESEPTFDGNAKLKAVAAATGSGLPALADDFGPRGRLPRRCARHLLGALGGAGQGFRLGDEAPRRGNQRRGTAGSRPVRAPTSYRCSVSLGPTATPGCSKARCSVISSGRRAAATGSATIRCSCPTAGPRRSARCNPRESTRSRIGRAPLLRSRRRCSTPSRPRPLHPRPARRRQAPGAILRRSLRRLPVYRRELKSAAFIARLKDDLAVHGSDWKNATLDAYLDALQRQLAEAPTTEEPAWRTSCEGASCGKQHD